jgi:hypothetical protein
MELAIDLGMGNINRTKLAELAQVSFYSEPEQVQIEGNASAIDPDTDRETYEWIRKELDAGNEWAWCTLVVRATYEDVPSLGGASVCGFSYLGCCSYESGVDAKRDNYEQMLAEALDDLASTLESTCTQAELAEMGLLEGQPSRTLVARFDVTGWTDAQISCLEMYIQAQAEASEHDLSDSEGLENYPDTTVTFKLED